MDAHTEQPDPTGATGATAPPPILVWSMAISSFSVVIWGLMLVFGRRPWDGSSRGPTLR